MLNRNLVVAALLMSIAGWSNSAHANDPIKRLADVQPNQQIFQNATVSNPLVLRSTVDAAQHFDEAELAKLKQSVDFEQQFVLVFAWTGSGQDKLDAMVLESFPEQIHFSYERGLTRDLRSHVQVFAVRSNVTWRAPGGVDVKPDGGAGAGAEKGRDYIQVEVKGKLNSQIMAIGGETTGVTITANGITWELQLGNQPDLRQAAEKLHEKTVVVRGNLTRKQGVEIRQRWIVEVSSLVDASEKIESSKGP